MTRITARGRGYPTAEIAVERLRDMLAADGIVPTSVEARRWTEKPVICPWEAVAEIADEDGERLLGHREARSDGA